MRRIVVVLGVLAIGALACMTQVSVPTLVPVWHTPVPTLTNTPTQAPQSVHQYATVRYEWNLRACAGLNCSVISWLYDGTQIEVLARSGVWVRVRRLSDGSVGWVHREALVE